MSLTHIVREPAAPGGGKAPLLLLLHGVRSNEHDLISLAPHLDPRLFFVSLRAPLTFAPGAYGWYNVQFLPGGDFLIDNAEAAASHRRLLESIDEILAKYPVDPRRVFLMGFSQGCIMSIGAALAQPQCFAGIVGLSGRLLPQTVAPPEEMRGLPVLLHHGTQDPVIAVRYGREIRDFLAGLVVRLDYREYEMGHQVTPESLADIAAWLRARLDDAQDWRTVSDG